MTTEEAQKPKYEKHYYLLSIFLTLFVGPLGLLYSSFIASVAMMIIMYSDFYELYFHVAKEPQLWDAYQDTTDYQKALGGIAIYWLACTPIGLVTVFLANRKLADKAN